MARNGTGVYTLPAGNPVITGTTISSTWANTTLNDIATALTGSVSSDGQTAPTANLPMATFAHTNVGDATLRNQYASAQQVQDNTLQHLTPITGTNTITATATVGMAAYAIGQRFSFIATGSNTGATTLNINGIGAKAITKNGTAALNTGDIISGIAYEVIYDGTQFQLIAGNNVSNGSQLGMRNRIINGAMMIDQRNAGAAISANNTGSQYSLDRWLVFGTAASKFTVQQNAGSVTPPAGYKNYLGCTSASAYSVSGSENFVVVQRVEGFNIADLGWGTASAAAVTLSFWVRSSLTGTFGGSLFNGAGNRSYPFSYTISASNTWEQKTITIAGDITGTWDTNNSIGVNVNFSLGAGATVSGTAGAWASGFYASATGATSVVGTNGATFYITGVQLEKGSTATPFDWRSYTVEESLCKRYYQALMGGIGIRASQVIAGGLWASIALKVEMRTTPTGIVVGTWTVGNCGQPVISTSVLSPSSVMLTATATTTGDTVYYTDTNAKGITLSAEL